VENFRERQGGAAADLLCRFGERRERGALLAGLLHREGLVALACCDGLLLDLGKKCREERRGAAGGGRGKEQSSWFSPP
jgi:hypothetical protein